MAWLRRTTGETTKSPTTPWVPGEWRYVGPGRLQIRDTIAQAGDVLVPDSEGRCQAAAFPSLRADRHLLPDDDALRSLRLIGERLGALRQEPWLMWTDVSPLVPPFGETLDESPLEVHLKERLGALEAVCQRPLTHLASEEERLLVARCKRPAGRAAVVLAARSDDWERRTLWGVYPKRVLGVIRDELLDIYENRLAVALVNRLSTALDVRLRALRRAVDQLRAKRDYQALVEGSVSYRKAQRITRLWAEADDDTEKLAQAEAAMNRVSLFRRRVSALKDSLLYRAIAGSVPALMRLRMTNVLTHDNQYRRVAELWEAWEEHVRSTKVDPEARWRQEQSSASGFDRFVSLVVIRALETLGFEPTEDSEDAPLVEGAVLRLRGPTGDLTLRRDRCDVRVVAEHSDVGVRIVGVPAMLAASATVGEWIETARRPDRVLIAWIPSDEERADDSSRNRIHSVGNRGESDGLSFVPIAPWDLESVERMARALRWHAWGSLYAAYPFGFRVHPARRAGLPTTSHLASTADGLHLRTPPELHVAIWPELRAKLRLLERNLGDLSRREKKLEGYIDEHQRGVRLDQEHGLRIGTVQTELQALRRDRDEMSQELDSLREALGDAEIARDSTDRLLVCPICGQSAAPRDFRGDGKTFAVRCGGCRAGWGLRGCAARRAESGAVCGGAVPFLVFASNDPTDAAAADDRRLGSDVLSIPVRDGAYVCPTCGRPSDGGAES